MQRPAPEDLQRLTRSMTAISSIMQRGQRKAVDPTRFGVLQLAMERQAMRPSEMAKELQVSASSITRQAQSLQEAGKIVMTEDPDDRRGYLISLTDEGRAELVELERLGMEFIGNELSDWDADKVQILGLLLSRLVETLAANHEQRQRDRAAASRPAG